MIEIYKTDSMIEVIKKSPVAPSFLGDRYFPTSDRDIFTTPQVWIERADNGKKSAGARGLHRRADDPRLDQPRP